MINYSTKWLIIFFLSIGPCFAFGQESSREIRNQARRHHLSGQYDSAAYYYDLLAKTLVEQNRLTESLMAEANMYYDSGLWEDKEGAVVHLNNLLQRIGPSAHRKARFLVHQRLGDIYNELENYKEAINHYEMALALSGTANSNEAALSKARVMFSLSLVNSKRSLFDESEAFLERVKQAYDSLDEGPIAQADLLNALGRIADVKGSLNEAVDLQNEAISLATKALDGPNHPYIAPMYRHLGIVHLKLGQVNLANTYLERCVAICRASGFQKHSAFVTDAMISLGDTYEQLGRLERSRQIKQEALSLSLELFGERNIRTATAYAGLGTLFYNEGQDFIKASKYYQRAADILEEVYGSEEHRLVGINLINAGVSLMRTEDFDKGLKQYEYGLEVLHRVFKGEGYELARFYFRLGVNLYFRQAHAQALGHFQNALIANAFTFGALERFQNPLTSDNRSQVLFQDVLAYKARALEGLYDEGGEVNDLKQAFKALQSADSVVNSLGENSIIFEDQIGFRRNSALVNINAIRITSKLYEETNDAQYLDWIFRFSEASKSNLILSNLLENETGENQVLPDSLLSLQRQQYRQMSELKSQLKALKTSASPTDSVENLMIGLVNARNKTMNHIRDHYPAYYEVRFKDGFQTIERVQSNLLSEDKLLIHYSLGTQNLYAFFITSDSCQLVRVPYEVDPRDITNQFLAQLSAPRVSFDSLLHTAQSLYHHLALDRFDLERYTDLLIVPDHDLNLIPFDLLLKELPTDGSQPDYLINNHNIAYANSASVLYRQLTQSRSGGRLKALALAPFYDEDALSENSKVSLNRAGAGTLNWSAQEVSNIRNSLKTDVIIGEEATKKRFIKGLKEYPIIHVASHGLLNPADPAASKLLFAMPDDGHESSLNMSEVLNMDIPANMVVLSACNTGKGEVVTGEGVIGLKGSFIYAGVGSLVMTLWVANDQSSSYIMESFYKYLAEGQPKSEALRNAKLSYLKNADPLFSHPYYWAHFVVNGDDRPLMSQGASTQVWLIVGLVLILFFLFYLNKRRAS